MGLALFNRVANRGLPHAHILVWLFPKHKITPDKIDDIVCAEIPDPALDPELHQIVVSNMVHGPCGSINLIKNSQAVKKGAAPKKAMVKKDVKSKVAAKKWL